jgi:hypothetical protein
MKCDELKKYKAYEFGTLYVYHIEEVEAAIAELKQKLENALANAYAESVDAGMRERRLKRALWLDRAKRAKAIKWHEGLERYLQERKKWWPSRFSFMKDNEMYHVWYKCWCEVERKCLAKAEEYK